MDLFGMVFGVAVAIELVVVAAFVFGLIHGTISGSGLADWTALLLVTGGLLGLGWALKAVGRPYLASLVVLVIAGPGVAIAFVMITLGILQPDFR